MRSSHRSEYRRDYEEDERARGSERERERDRGRRQGEHNVAAPGTVERTPISPRALRRSRSPQRSRSRPTLPSRVGYPTSPTSWDSRTTISTEPRSPFTRPLQPTEAVSNPKVSKSTSVRPESRDPRLLNRINTLGSAATRSVSSPLTAKSPTIAEPTHERGADQRRNSESLSAVSRSGHVLPIHNQTSSPSASGAGSAQDADLASLLTTLLGSLFENASNSAALKYEHSKVKAKALHQANLDKKMGDLSKTFPAFAETSSKAKKEAEKDLALLDQKLAEHQKSQNDLLSAVPGILQASRIASTSEKEREQMDVVKRCMSVYEDFKSNVEDLKQKFAKQESAAFKRDQAFRSIDEKIVSSTVLIKDLTSELEYIRSGCSTLDKKHEELIVNMKTFTGELRSSLSALKINLKQCVEHGQQHKDDLETTNDKVDKLSQRLGGLEMQYHTIGDSQSLHQKQAEALKKSVDGHYRELQEMKASVVYNENLSDAVHAIAQDIQDLRETMSEIQTKNTLSPIVQQLSALDLDVKKVNAGLLEVKNDRVSVQDLEQIRQKLSLINAEPGSPLRELGTAGSDQRQTLTDLESRLKSCVEDVTRIHELLNDKQAVEEERDDIVAAQVDDFRASITTTKEDFNRRIGTLEIEVQKQRAEDLSKTQKLQDSLSQLSKNTNHFSTPRISPPSAPPTPQMQQMMRPQATSSSPQPLIPLLPPDVMISKRLDSTDSLLSATRQQLQAVTMAFQQLDRRYNSLSTEPIVRAMVLQMQSMYPYASEAQREIFNLKQTFESLKSIPQQLDTLKHIAGDHNARYANVETRIDALEKERTRYDAKQDSLVQHVKEERGKLMDEVSSQKEAVNSLDQRIGHLEDYQKTEPDKFDYLIDKLAKKWQVESTQALETITRRLDVLETGISGQDLLEAFTKEVPTKKSPEQSGELRDVEDTDDSSVPLQAKMNELRSKATNSSAPSGLGKALLRSKAASNAKKRKRLGSQDNNDRSDDETWTPKVQSSPGSVRRRYRG
jgi:chromosome segregation ATPase